MNLKNLAIGLVSAMGLGTAVGVTSVAVKTETIKETRAVDETYSLCGTINGWEPGNHAYDMVTSNGVATIKNVSLSANAKFKVIKGHAWGTEYATNNLLTFPAGAFNGGNSNDDIYVNTTGTYDISLDISTSRINIRKNGISEPSYKTFYLIQNSDWSDWVSPRIHYWGSSLETNWGNTPSLENLNRTYTAGGKTGNLYSCQIPVDTTGLQIRKSDGNTPTENLSVDSSINAANFYYDSGNKLYGFNLELVENGAYLRGSWSDGWAITGQKTMSKISTNEYRINNLELDANTKLKMAFMNDGVETYADTHEAWSLDKLSFPVEKQDNGDVLISKAGTYDIRAIKNNTQWDYEVIPVQSEVADGGYLRGDWENGWIVSGQKKMTLVGTDSYSISNVILGAYGKVKIVTYSSGVITWCQVGTVTSTDSTNYPANLVEGDVVVTNAGTYTISVVKSGNVWNYTFTGTSNPNLEAAEEFAANFKTAMQINCPYTGTNKTTSDLKTAWEQQAGIYGDLTTAVKDYLLDDETTDVNISDFQERYADIYGRYGTSLSLTNFLSGGASSNRLSISNDNSSNALPAILVGSSVVSIIAVGGYFFIKKKQF